jgi:hypothetical protein
LEEHDLFGKQPPLFRIMLCEFTAGKPVRDQRLLPTGRPNGFYGQQFPAPADARTVRFPNSLEKLKTNVFD